MIKSLPCAEHFHLHDYSTDNLIMCTVKLFVNKFNVCSVIIFVVTSFRTLNHIGGASGSYV